MYGKPEPVADENEEDGNEEREEPKRLALPLWLCNLSCWFHCPRTLLLRVDSEEVILG